MRDRQLFYVSVVTDDETGIYNIGEFDYGVPATTQNWLAANPEKRKPLAEWTRMLADRIESGEAPFKGRDRADDIDAAVEEPR